MPIEGEPADTVKRIEAYDTWLASSPETPKLLLTFDDSLNTLMTGPEMSTWAQEYISSLDVEACGPAAHVRPEDQPETIGRAIAVWADRHKLR